MEAINKIIYYLESNWELGLEYPFYKKILFDCEFFLTPRLLQITIICLNCGMLLS